MNKILVSGLATAVAAASSSAAIINVTSSITTDTTWSAPNEYVLTDIIYVENEATLTIQPGTVIRGEPLSAPTAYDPGTLVVTREGQIKAKGTSADPIIFTTALVTDETVDYGAAIDYSTKTFVDANPKGSPLLPGENFSFTPGNTAHLSTQEYRGLWGGVIILGNAPTNIMNVADGKLTHTDKTPRADLDDIFEGFIEGLDPDGTAAQRGIYGGSNPNDSSGTFEYVSIRHGGTNLAEGNEINGLTMGGVGFGTRIQYIEVYCNNDDGFEWFGGTVNTRYLVSLYNNDDSFDIDEGFTGLGQFWFSLQLDDGTNGDHGGEHDGTNGSFDNADVEALNGYVLTGAGDDASSGTGDSGFGVPIAFPTIYNATYVGAGTSEQMLKFEDSFGGDYFNSIFVGAEREFVDADNSFVKDGSPASNNMADRIAAADCDFVSNSVIYDINGNTGSLANTDLSNNSALAAILAANGNVTGTNPFSTLSSATVRQNVDPRASSATPGGVALQDVTATFFIEASYAGAFDPVETKYWTDDWSVFSAHFDNK